MIFQHFSLDELLRNHFVRNYVEVLETLMRLEIHFVSQELGILCTLF
jgi:hypothetical protein